MFNFTQNQSKAAEQQDLAPELKALRLSDLLHSSVSGLIDYIYSQFPQHLSSENKKFLKNYHQMVDHYKHLILDPSYEQSSPLTHSTPNQKAAHSNASTATVNSEYYNRGWSIFEKVYYVLIQSDQQLSVPELLEKILEIENIPADSDEARRMNVNLNATLSNKFRPKEGQERKDPIERKKVRNEFKYFIRQEESSAAA